MTDSRRKGGVGEREAIKFIRERGWPDARRTSDGRTQRGRGDVALGPPGVHIEVRRRERLNVRAAYEDAVRDADPSQIPTVMHRTSRAPWLVTLSAEDWFAILRARP